MSASAQQAPVLIVGGGIGGLCGGAGAVAQGHPGAGAGAGAGVQGDRRRHPARAQRVPHVRGAGPDRADVPLVRVSRRAWRCATRSPAKPSSSMPIDERFHDKYHAPYARDPPRRHAQRHPRRLQEIEPDQARHLAEGRRDRRRPARRHGAAPRAGETFNGAALIGCDGLWSTIREKIVGDGKPVVSGHIAYRAVLPTSEWPAEYRLPR